VLSLPPWETNAFCHCPFATLIATALFDIYSVQLSTFCHSYYLILVAVNVYRFIPRNLVKALVTVAKWPDYWHLSSSKEIY
jgi:hypothetical protein